MIYFKKQYFLLLTSLLLGCFSSSYAQLSDSSKQWQDQNFPSSGGKKNDPFSSLPQIIKGMISKGSGVSYMDSFAAPSGMTGYVLSAKNGERRIFYVPADGKVAILGLIFDEKMQNLTAEHQKKYMNVLEFNDPTKLPENPYVDSFLGAVTFQTSAMLEDTNKTFATTLHIFVDPASSDFPALYKMTRDKVKDIRIFWIPVPGPNTDASFDAAIAISSAKDRAAAAQEYFSLSAEDKKNFMTNNTALKALNRNPSSKLIDKTKKTMTDAFTFRKALLTEKTTWLSFQGPDNESIVTFGFPTASDWKQVEKGLKWRQSLSAIVKK